MVCYFDSSFLLSALLEERPESDHVAWDQARERLSSDLLRSECGIALRRAFLAQPPGTPADWVAKRVAKLDEFLARITFKALDTPIETIVRGEERLAGCRTVDAIHVATALYFAPHLDELIEVCTFDGRMRAAAIALGLAVRPAPT
jgi:predicted nucleic acid-binding protein